MNPPERERDIRRRQPETHDDLRPGPDEAGLRLLGSSRIARPHSDVNIAAH